MNIAERLISYRARHHLTQKQLAELIGEGSGVIHRAESGKHKPHKANEMRLNFKMDELEEKEK